MTSVNTAQRTHSSCLSEASQSSSHHLALYEQPREVKCHHATPRSVVTLMSVSQQQSATLESPCDSKVTLRGKTLISCNFFFPLSDNEAGNHP